MIYELSFGGVIGWWRDRKLIPYDWDLDVVVKLDVWKSKEYERVLNGLETVYGICIEHTEEFKVRCEEKIVMLYLESDIIITTN